VATPNHQRDKADMIRYTRNDAGNDHSLVECGSCHDTHENDGTAALLTSNANGQVCPAGRVK
jgi:hypothetical protein